MNNDVVQTWRAICRFTGDPGCLGWPGWYDHPRAACVWEAVRETSCPRCGWTTLMHEGPHDEAACRRVPPAPYCDTGAPDGGEGGAPRPPSA